MLARSSNGSYEFIDFRETMPAAGFQDMYNNNTNASIYGGMARYASRLSKADHRANIYQWRSWRASRHRTSPQELWCSSMEDSSNACCRGGSKRLERNE
jgi:hypothetical protein